MREFFFNGEWSYLLLNYYRTEAIYTAGDLGNPVGSM